MNHIARSNKIQQMLPQGSEELRIVSFFFDYRGGTNTENSLEGLKRSLLIEIALVVPELSERLRERFGIGAHPDDETTMRRVDVGEILEDILSINDHHLLVFVDGLDEYQGHGSDLIRFIRQMEKRKNIKICLSSRPDPPFSIAFRDNKFTFRMDEINRPGITAYARDTLDISLSPSTENYKQVLDRAAEKIAEKSSGMFLWAQFAVFDIIDATGEGRTLNDALISSTLANMPSKLEDVYARIFDARNVQERKTCGVLFQLIHSAKCPLEPSELLQAASYAGLDLLASRGTLTDQELLGFPQYLRALSGGTLDVVTLQEPAIPAGWKSWHDEYGTSEGLIAFVRTIHRTVQTYLDKKGWTKLVGSENDTQSRHQQWLEVLRSFAKDRCTVPGPRRSAQLSQHWTAIKLGLEDDLREKRKYRFQGTILPAFAKDSDDMQPRNTVSRHKSLHEYMLLFLPHHALDFERESKTSCEPFVDGLFNADFIEDHVSGYAASDAGAECYCGICHEASFLLGGSLHFAIAHGLLHYVKGAVSRNPSLANVEGVVPTSTFEPASWPRDDSGLPKTTTTPLATALFCCCLESTVTRCQIAKFLIPLSPKLHDEDMLFAIQAAPIDIVRRLLAACPLGRLQFKSRWLLHDHRIFHCKISFVEPRTFGPLWAVGMRNNCHEAELLLETFLERGKDVNADCGPHGTIVQAVVIKYLDQMDLNETGRAVKIADIKRILRMLLNHGADINAPGPAGNVLEYAWKRANNDPWHMLSVGDIPHYWALVRLLLELGAVNNTRDPNGLIPGVERMSNFFAKYLADSHLADKHFYVHGAVNDCSDTLLRPGDRLKVHQSLEQDRDRVVGWTLPQTLEWHEADCDSIVRRQMDPIAQFALHRHLQNFQPVPAGTSDILQGAPVSKKQSCVSAKIGTGCVLKLQP